MQEFVPKMRSDRVIFWPALFIVNLKVGAGAWLSSSAMAWLSFFSFFDQPLLFQYPPLLGI